MLFNSGLRFARIDSSRRRDIFRRCFDWQHWNISYRRQSSHCYPNTPQFLKKPWDPCHQETFINDVFTAGGFYSSRWERREWTEHYLPSRYCSPRVTFLYRSEYQTFYILFLFTSRSKACHIHMSRRQDKSTKKPELWQLSVKQPMRKGSKWKQFAVPRHRPDLNAWKNSKGFTQSEEPSTDSQSIEILAICCKRHWADSRWNNPRSDAWSR